MKRLTAITILILLPVVMFAWERRSDTTLYLGYSGGISFSGLRNFYNDFDRRIAQNHFVFAEFQPTREFSLRGGFSYQQKGYNYTSRFDDVLGNPFDTTTISALNYISVPVSACYNLGQRFNPYVGAGMELSFLAAARQYARLPATRNGIAVDPFDVDMMDSGYFHKIEFSVNAVGGIEYRIKPQFSVFTEASYATSLTKLYAINTTAGNNVKTTSLSVKLGVKIGIPLRFVV